MDIAALLTRLWNLRRAMVVAVVLSVVIGIALTYKVSLSPPSIKQPKLRIASAQTQILLDSPNSAIGDLSSDTGPLADRAAIYTQFLESEEVRAKIAKVTGLPPNSFVMEGQSSTFGSPGADQRSQQIITEAPINRLFFSSERGSPVIQIISQSPDPKIAFGLADGAAKAISEYVTTLQDRQRIPALRRLRIEQMGAAQGGYINSGIGRSQVVVTTIGVFLVLVVLLLVASNVIVDFRRARNRGDQLDAEWAESQVEPERILAP